MMFALCAKVRSIIGILILIIGLACGGEDGPGNGLQHCDLTLNISAERQIDQTNFGKMLSFNRGDAIILKYELINGLNKETYKNIRLYYNISDIYLFPIKCIKATDSDPYASVGLFSIWFNRKNNDSNDYFKVDKTGFLDICFYNFNCSEKVSFYLSTQIANKSFKKDEIDIAEYLHAEDIEFNASDITYDSKYIKINKINNIIINDINGSNGTLVEQQDYSLLIPFSICIFILVLIIYIGNNLYRSHKKS